MESILLSEFKPKSELRVEEHIKSSPLFPVIDFHTHFGRLLFGENYADLYDTAAVVEALQRMGVRKVVNLDGDWGDYLERMLDKTKGYEDFFITFGTLDIARFEEADFEQYVVKTIENSVQRGVKGLKFWKNISLSITDSQGRYLRVDDDRLDVIWETAGSYHLPVLIHIADPVAFFKPIDAFNERFEELHVHPEWSFSDEKYYRFEELMEMQENLFAKHKNTTFVVAHAGSCAEDLSYVSRLLDRFPNIHIDIAARIAELGRQPYTARRFFNQYSDRIIFGTDATPFSTDLYPVYYRCLETFDEYFDYTPDGTPNQGRWKIYGIGLEQDVLEKVYYKNAEKLLYTMKG